MHIGLSNALRSPEWRNLDKFLYIKVIQSYLTVDSFFFFNMVEHSLNSRVL